MRMLSRRQRNASNDGSLAKKISRFTNPTFVKDYQNTSSLDADYSVGSPTATFTASRDATHPATYVDASGVIKTVTTANVPRYQGGYYDLTGFHLKKGLMIERISENLIPKSYTMDDAVWDATNVTVVDGATTDPAGGSNAASLTASAANGTVILHTAVTARSYSVWIKRKTGTGKIYLMADSGVTYEEIAVTSSWCRFTCIAATSASQTVGIKIETDTDAIYVYGNQFENLPFVTSFIPTSSVALTRNGEYLKYETGAGTELVTNGTAWTGATGVTPPTGWTDAAAGAGTYDIDSGTLKMTCVTNNAQIQQTITVVAGQTYTVSVKLKNSDLGNGITFQAGTSAGGTQYASFVETGTTDFVIHSKTFTATQAALHIQLRTDASGAPQFGWADRVYVRKTGTNRTAATESIFIKFASNFRFLANGTVNALLNDEIEAADLGRYVSKAALSNVLKLYPYADGTVSSVANGTTVNQEYTDYVFGGVVQATGNHNAEIFSDGVSEGTSDTDYTINPFGEHFYIGSTSTLNQIDGVIQSIAIFSDVKGADDVLLISTVLSEQS